MHFLIKNFKNIYKLFNIVLDKIYITIVIKNGINENYELYILYLLGYNTIKDIKEIEKDWPVCIE